MGKARATGPQSTRRVAFAAGIAASLLIALAACSAGVAPNTVTPAPTAAQAATQRSERISEGESKFLTAGCAACHGVRGEGGIGPRSSNTPMHLDDLQLLVRSGAMNGVKYDDDELTDQDITNIYLWLQTNPAGDEPIP